MNTGLCHGWRVGTEGPAECASAAGGAAATCEAIPSVLGSTPVSEPPPSTEAELGGGREVALGVFAAWPGCRALLPPRRSLSWTKQGYHARQEGPQDK